MSRNLLLLAGGAIAVLVIVGMFFLPTMQQDGFSFGFQVIGVDENGSPVTIPFSWWIQGVEVVNIRPTGSWSCSGDGLDWTTLFIAGDFRIYRLDYQGRNPTDITPTDLSFERSGVNAQEGSTYFSISCDNILDGAAVSGIDSEDNEYWNIKITFSITGFVEQEGSFGDDLTDSFTDSLTFTIKWIDGDFSIGGGITR